MQMCVIRFDEYNGTFDIVRDFLAQASRYVWVSWRIVKGSQTAFHPTTPHGYLEAFMCCP